MKKILFPNLHLHKLAFLHIHRWVVLLPFYFICLYWFRFPDMFAVMLPVMIMSDLEYGNTRLSRQINYFYIIVVVNMLCVLVTVYSKEWALMSLVITMLGAYSTYSIAKYGNGFFPLAFFLIMTTKGVYFKHYEIYQLLEMLFTLNVFAILIYFLIFFIVPSNKELPYFNYVSNVLKKHDYIAICRSICSFLTTMIFINYYNLTISSFMVTTVILLSIPGANISVKKLIHRILGTIVGVLLGGLIIYMDIDKISVYLLIFFIVANVGFFFMFTSHYFIAVIFVTAMIVSSSYIFSAFEPTLFENISTVSFLMDRFFNVLMGCVIVMVFTILIPDKKSEVKTK